MEQGLLDKTGKSLDQWIVVVKKTGLSKHSEIIKMLKADHGFTHGYANFVALKARGADAASHQPEELLTNQYQGKESLRPIYEALVKVVDAFGEDVKRVPKKDSVSVIRNKQFALIKPATKTRIDLGLKLKGKPTDDRLESSGPFGSMCTHRVRLTTPDQVDTELKGWLKEAYDKAL